MLASWNLYSFCMKKIIFILITMAFCFSVSLPALAADFPSLVPEECRGSAELDRAKCADCAGKTPAQRVAQNKTAKKCCCDLSSVEAAAFNIAQIILGVSGSLALLMFVCGGIMYVASAGSPEKVKKATDVLKYAVIGLAIILLSGLAVKILLKTLAGQ